MKRNYSLILLGTDPEFFIHSVAENRIVPCTDKIIQGTKGEPFKLTELGEGFSTQLDNVLLEVCVPPASNKEDFDENLDRVLDYVQDEILGKAYKIRIFSSAEFKEEDLQTEQAQTFGCSVDYNAYTEAINDAPDPHPFKRGAGFHLHVKFTEDSPTIEEQIKLVKMLDLMLGVPSVLLDEDSFRREGAKGYGKAGCFRPCDDRVEYRVLGGNMAGSYSLINYIWDQVDGAIKLLDQGFDVATEKGLSQRIVECINTSNKELAKQLIADYIIDLPDDQTALFNEIFKLQTV